jgi:hypothetical protein
MPAVSRSSPSIALIAVLVVSGACGGSGPDSGAPERTSSAAATVDADFSARADAVCAPYADFTRKAYLRLSGFNRYAPDAALLPRVAAHLEENTAYQRLLADLEDLGDPESAAAGWTTVLDDLRATAQDVKQETAGARAADLEAFSELATQLEQDTTQLHTDLGVVGMADSSCVAAEGDPLKPPPAHEG